MCLAAERHCWWPFHSDNLPHRGHANITAADDTSRNNVIRSTTAGGSSSSSGGDDLVDSYMYCSAGFPSSFSSSYFCDARRR